MTNKEQIALRVNEIFHDIEGKEYQKKHDDIFGGEAMRWKKNIKQYIKLYKHPVTILDIGTGTGFIPLTIASYLNKNDVFICSDISKEMLNVAKINILEENFECKFIFQKLNGIKVSAEKVSIITMNSVVHHIPNLKNFFLQLNEILIQNGRIIIGHEPNKYFYTNKKLVNYYLFFKLFSSPKKLLKTIARTIGISKIIKKTLKSKVNNNKIVFKINEILLKENLINKELSEDEINKMIDFHSPSAGSKLDKTKGINIYEIQKKYLPNFEVEYFETYNFLSKMSNQNFLLKKISNSLSKKYNGKGATFFAVLKKKSIYED